jgi:hypothetical protein
MTAYAKRPSHSKRAAAAVWSAIAFLAIGYVPTLLLGSPAVSMILSAATVIPYGSKASSVRRGLLRGALLGLAAGLAMTSAVDALLESRVRSMPAQSRPATLTGALVNKPASSQAASVAALGSAPTSRPATTSAAPFPATTPASPKPSPLPPGAMAKLAAVYAGATMALCTSVAGLFAMLKQRRLKRIDQMWDSLE